MSKWAMVAAAGFFLGLCLPLTAQETADVEAAPRVSLDQAVASGAIEARPSVGRSGAFSALNNVWYGPAALALSDGQRFSFPSAFAWTEASLAEYLPTLVLAEAPRTTTPLPPVTYTRDKSLGLLPRPDYATSEVGIFYGKSTGKYGREVEAGYIMSEIVEGNTHINVGISYEHADGRRPRLNR